MRADTKTGRSQVSIANYGNVSTAVIVLMLEDPVTDLMGVLTEIIVSILKETTKKLFNISNLPILIHMKCFKNLFNGS